MDNPYKKEFQKTLKFEKLGTIQEEAQAQKKPKAKKEEAQAEEKSFSQNDPNEFKSEEEKKRIKFKSEKDKKRIKRIRKMIPRF